MNSPTKLPSLRPVMTEREKVLESELQALVKYFDVCLTTGALFLVDIRLMKESAQKALNFKYGGEE